MPSDSPANSPRAEGSDESRFLARRDVDVKINDEAWLEERKCILLLIESRMLLRELVEYKLKMIRMASGNLTIAEIQNLLSLNPDAGGDEDFISEIEELKKQLVREVRRNHSYESELEKLETRIALLIQNRTSIQEIDRQIKKSKKQQEHDDGESEPTDDFSQNKKILEKYSHFFYALQVEPKYLAKIAYVIPSEKRGNFVNLILLSLYGDAFSPREEYLILKLFNHAIEYEFSHIKKVEDFIQTDSVVPKMILTYNKRKQGIEYIKNNFTNLILKEVAQKDLNFELSPTNVYNKLLNDQEVKSKDGKKSKMKKMVSNEEAANHPEVKNIISQRLKQLQQICQAFLDKIFSTMSSLPYGLRLVCKLIREVCLDRFPKSKPEQILSILGYFVGYRFIGLGISSPDAFGIINRDQLPLSVVKALASINKVISIIFRLSEFSADDELAPLNDWIRSNRKKMIEYFADLVDVPQPEDYLQVNQYMELTQRTKPMIMLSMGEIVFAHNIVKNAASSVIKDKDDPLNIILKDLGDVPKISKHLKEKEVQLQLENRFKDKMQDEIKPGLHTYAETKELIIQIFKNIPVAVGHQTLPSILKFAKNYAKEESNKQLLKNVEKTLKNLETLEQNGLVSKKDKYTSLLRDVALEAANRAERREQQQKEIARLRATLKNVKKHQEYMINQIKEFQSYLDTCRKNSIARAKMKKKPLKFSYKDLVKKKVIEDSDVPEKSRGLCKFFISMPEVGQFDIEAKIAGLSVGKMKLELEDLLERKEQNKFILNLDNIVLNVPPTILFINKYFLG